MNKYSIVEQTSSLNLGTTNNLRLTYSHISNIQKFLNKYKKISTDKVSQLEIDEKDEEVYSSDSVLPDMYLKTRIPIERKKMYMSSEDEKKKSRKGRADRNSSNFKGHNRNQPKYEKRAQGSSESTYFPLVPLTMPSEISHVPRQMSPSQKFLKLENISVDKLFSTSDEKELPQKETQNAKDYVNKSGKQHESGDIPTSFPSNDFSFFHSVTKDEFLMNDIMEKIWFLSFFHNGRFINYGPVNTQKIYLFLKNLYFTLSQAEREKKNFMVVDTASDVHFQPDTLYEILTVEYEKKTSQVVPHKKDEQEVPNTLKIEEADNKQFFFDKQEKENLKPANYSYLNRTPYRFEYDWKVVGNHRKRQNNKFTPFKPDVVGMRKADKTKAHNSYQY